MRRTHIALVGALALALPLTACGDSGDGGEAAEACTPLSSLTVGAQDSLSFDADAYDAEAGCIEMTYVNEGSVAHTLLVKGEQGFKLAVGDEDSGTIALDPGTYTLYCDIAGHESAGMHAELTVE